MDQFCVYLLNFVSVLRLRVLVIGDSVGYFVYLVYLILSPVLQTFIYSSIQSLNVVVSDTAFLLLFLRVRYFAQLEARELLEKFLSRRTKLSKWFRNLDTTDHKV